MLIIYGALGLGGIETFFVRLAKDRFMSNKKTKILLLAPPELEKNDPDLFNEMLKYADIYYFSDVFENSFINWRFLFLHRLKNKNLEKMLHDCKQIHVTDSQSALLANNILAKANKKIPITVGMYHSLEFSWGEKKLPFFERVNRNFIFKTLSSGNLMCFSQNTKDFVVKKTGYEIKNAKTFRLGVIDSNQGYKKSFKLSKKIKMCAVGRLTDFKTYNFWMPNVIKELNISGCDIHLDIYGDGGSVNTVKSAVDKVSDYVSLFPPFNYSNFNKIVSEYDLFIGSGTAIIQAASLGVPCIIGIESIEEPVTYGFFSDFYQYEYNLKSLNFEKIKIFDIIDSFSEASSDFKENLILKHYQAAQSFDISTCQNNMDDESYVVSDYFYFNKWIYTLSLVFFRLKMKISRQTIYHEG